MKHRGTFTNKDTGKEIPVFGGSVNELLQHDTATLAHLQSFAAIQRIVEDSIYIATLPNEDKENHPRIKGFEYYVCGLRIGNENYTVKAVVAIERNGIRYYDHKLSQIEKGALLSDLSDVTKPAGKANAPFDDFKDKRLLEILQSDFSKVVDENGEPMVVYHGTSAERFIRDMVGAKKGGLKDALRFVPDKEKALAWLGLVPPKGTASLTEQELHLRDIIERFENPSIANDVFNKELEAFEAGTHKGVLHLGRPGAILRASGLNATEITITRSKLGEHLEKHGIKASEIRDLPSALNNPLMVYEWGTKARSLIVITDMTLADGRKITGAVALERDGVVAELNELASVHGKSLERLLNDATVKEKDFGKNKLKYVDKKRALEWLKLAYAPLAPAHQSTQELLLRDIIERFENPSIENDDDAKFSLSAMESPNDIIKKLPNRSFKRSRTRGLHDINERSRRMIQEFIRKHNEFYSKPAHVRQLKLAGIALAKLMLARKLETAPKALVDHVCRGNDSTVLREDVKARGERKIRVPFFCAACHRRTKRLCAFNSKEHRGKQSL